MPSAYGILCQHVTGAHAVYTVNKGVYMLYKYTIYTATTCKKLCWAKVNTEAFDTLRLAVCFIAGVCYKSVL